MAIMPLSLLECGAWLVWKDRRAWATTGHQCRPLLLRLLTMMNRIGTLAPQGGRSAAPQATPDSEPSLPSCISALKLLLSFDVIALAATLLLLRLQRRRAAVRTPLRVGLQVASSAAGGIDGRATDADGQALAHGCDLPTHKWGGADGSNGPCPEAGHHPALPLPLQQVALPKPPRLLGLPGGASGGSGAEGPARTNEEGELGGQMGAQVLVVAACSSPMGGTSFSSMEGDAEAAGAVLIGTPQPQQQGGTAAAMSAGAAMTAGAGARRLVITGAADSLLEGTAAGAAPAIAAVEPAPVDPASARCQAQPTAAPETAGVAAGGPLGQPVLVDTNRPFTVSVKVGGQVQRMGVSGWFFSR